MLEQKIDKQSNAYGNQNLVSRHMVSFYIKNMEEKVLDILRAKYNVRVTRQVAAEALVSTAACDTPNVVYMPGHVPMLHTSATLAERTARRIYDAISLDAGRFTHAPHTRVSEREVYLSRLWTDAITDPAATRHTCRKKGLPVGYTYQMDGR